jgi:hypothetical protein
MTTELWKFFGGLNKKVGTLLSSLLILQLYVSVVYFALLPYKDKDVQS